MTEPNDQPNVLLLCPTCKKPVKEHRQDSIQTWYICENGHQTAYDNLIKQELDELQIYQRKFCEALNKQAKEVQELATNPDVEQVFLDDLHKTVAEHDDHISKANFHTALSMYHVAVNNAVKAESGAGKTYVSLAIISYFPEENVVVIGSQSPKVVSHDYGELMTGNDEQLNLEDAPVKPFRKDYASKKDFLEMLEIYKSQRRAWHEKLKNSYYLIRLSNKTLVFLDTISFETFEMFKCILSHDKPRITHKYVDERGRVHTTVLEGWPSAIFCSVDKKWLAEFTTRTFTVSPSTSKEKIKRAMNITTQKNAYPWDYEHESPVKILIRELIRNIRDTFQKYSLKVVIPFPGLEDLFAQMAVRDMRDYNHFGEILPAYTMLKMFQRPIITIKGKRYLVATLEDVKAAKALFDEIEETTKTGTEKAIIDFYEQFVRDKVDGTTLDPLVENYNSENKGNPKSDYTIRFYLKRLNRIGWVDIRKGKVVTDKRKDTFYPLKDIEDPQRKINENSGKKEIQLDLERKLKIGFKIWLETISKNELITQCENFEFFERKLVSLSTEDFVKNVVGVSLDDLQLVSENDLKPNPETEPKSSGKAENQPVPQNNGEPYFNSCCFCGKPIYDSDAVTDDFTEHKPAHSECYKKQKALLKPKQDYPSFPEPGDA